MLSFCLKCRKNMEIVRSKNSKIMLLSKCAVYNLKNRNFLNNKNLEDH